MKFTDLFEPCKPSFGSQSKSSGAKMSPQQMWRHAAPVGIETCLAYTPGSATFSSRDIFNDTPEINQAYQTSKTLGDRLGQGIAGHGLGLHPAPVGGYLRCRENALLLVLGACCPEFLKHRQRMADGESPEDVLATAELGDTAVEELIAATGFDDIQALSAAIKGLPSLSDLGFAAQKQDAPDETVADGQVL